MKNPAGIVYFTYPGMQEVINAMEASNSLARPLKAADAITASILNAAYAGRTKTCVPM